MVIKSNKKNPIIKDLYFFASLRPRAVHGAHAAAAVGGGAFRDRDSGLARNTGNAPPTVPSVSVASPRSLCSPCA